MDQTITTLVEDIDECKRQIQEVTGILRDNEYKLKVELMRENMGDCLSINYRALHRLHRKHR